jgi:hypothetical protein
MGEEKMKKKKGENILKEAGVLLIAAIVILSSVAATAITYKEQPKKITEREIKQDKVITGEEIPSFVKGSLNGNINDVNINASFNVDIYPEEGLCIGKIDPIPLNVGHSLTSLESIITFICFSFSLSHDGCINGWDLTGGNFTRDVNVLYDTGEMVVMHNICSYFGGDTVWVDANIEGNVYDVNPDSNIEIEDYNDNWIQTNNNTITGEAFDRVFYVDDQIHNYDWSYTYIYDGANQIPFPQTRCHTVNSYYYDPDNETLHFEHLGNLYPSEQKPFTPYIEGETKGKINTEYLYQFGTNDPNDDNIFYFIDWGDGSYERWIGPYESGETAEVSHSWDEKGSYTIRAMVKNTKGLQSYWETLEVLMPKNKASYFNFNLLNWLFERFPNEFPILRHLLEH